MQELALGEEESNPEQGEDQDPEEEQPGRRQGQRPEQQLEVHRQWWESPAETASERPAEGERPVVDADSLATP